MRIFIQRVVGEIWRPGFWIDDFGVVSGCWGNDRHCLNTARRAAGREKPVLVLRFVFQAWGCFDFWIWVLGLDWK